MDLDLTTGEISKKILKFSYPMILGNLLQQVYNFADTFIVGRYIGPDALAAVGGTYTLTTLIYSVIIGLTMGYGALVSYYLGNRDHEKIKKCSKNAFFLIGLVSLALTAFVLLLSREILVAVNIPYNILSMTEGYLRIILAGVVFVFLYNFAAYFSRAVGNSVVPLIFLGLSSIINIGLDIYFVVYRHWGINGAAIATLIAQIISGLGLFIFSLIKNPLFNFKALPLEGKAMKEIIRQSGMASIQQSVMNFGILVVQGIVNSFGTAVIVAFTVAVKIDTLAYLPAQEFGNAFSLFVSQNHGAGKKDRINEGCKSAVKISFIFCIISAAIVFIFGGFFMGIFVGDNKEIIDIGVRYLRIEGSFYFGIGMLFLFYGYFRGINRPEISLVLTVVSLGTRCLLAWLLPKVPAVGVTGIWVSIPIGWVLADLAGLKYYRNSEVAQKIK